jgi:hypothetical protein
MNLLDIWALRQVPYLTDNTAAAAAGGPVLFCAHVDLYSTVL